jgi:serine protease Do
MMIARFLVLLLLFAFGPGAMARAETGPGSVAALARHTVPAVVNISISRSVGLDQGEPYPTAPDGSPLKDFLEENNPNAGLGEDEMMLARSLGSGFIISPDGVIVTNNHVIAGANDIEVFLDDGTRLKARLVGADEKTDLAVLKVDAGRALAFVEFGDSDGAEVGDWVMAVGNPFGLGGSVTLGIVSARNRDIQSGPYEQFIQTDAAINQGNSGGPLFDMAGKVVGINTAILAQGGTALGIGFAVPVNLAKPVIAQLRQFGETRRGWLGVGIQEVSEDIRLSMGLASTKGALVLDVMDKGPSAGLIEPGDVVLSFDGRSIETLRDLPRFAAEAEIGKSVSIGLVRQGRALTVAVTPGRLEDGAPQMAAGLAPAVPQPLADETIRDIAGFEVVAIDEKARAQFGLTPEITGLLVSAVTPGSDADDKGFVAGLVILEMNQEAYTSVEALTGALQAAKEDGRPAVLFRVSDAAGEPRFIAVRLR